MFTNRKDKAVTKHDPVDNKFTQRQGSWQRRLGESSQRGGAQQDQDANDDKRYRRQNSRCYNCGKIGHFAHDCWFKEVVEGNVATTVRGENNSEKEEEWDFQASFASEEPDELASGCIIEPEEEIAFASLIGLTNYNYDLEAESIVLPDLEEIEEKLGGEKKEEAKHENDTSIPIEKVDEPVQSKEKEKKGVKEEIERMIVDKSLVIEGQAQEEEHEEGSPLQAQKERIEEQRQTQEEECEERSPQLVLQRSLRQRKSNSKYSNDALVAELKPLKSATYKEAFKKFKQGKIRGKIQRELGILTILIDGESSC